MVNVALIQNDTVVNVAVFDDDVWDFETWARFEDEYDELVVLDDSNEPWIGWTRPGPKDPFTRPDDG